ncbi:MAG: nitrilase-related carbon-nitrogen hydrolase [Candidatus Porifericomitaceae bacterium WSBS_2022_MAG_OTU9]
MRLAVAQFACGEDRRQNYQNFSEAAHEAVGSELLLLPELAAYPYFCQQEDSSYFDLAEDIPGDTTDLMCKLAVQHKMVIVTTVFEKCYQQYYNTAVVADSNGQLAGIYRKMHIPQDPGYREKFYFTPGDTGFVPITTSVGRLGVMVCWDQWFPEAARIMALAGANMLLYPTAIGYAPADDAQQQQRQLDAWITIQRAHAIANVIPVAAANRTGKRSDGDQHTDFWGNSFVAGAQGEILAQAKNTATVIRCDIDTKRSQELRRTWPFYRDRRTDAYGDIMQHSPQGNSKAKNQRKI